MDSTTTQRSGWHPWNELCEDHDHDCSLGSGRKSLRQFEGSTYYSRFQYKPITLYERLASWILSSRFRFASEPSSCPLTTIWILEVWRFTLQEPHHPDYFVHTNFVYKFCSTTVMSVHTLAALIRKEPEREWSSDYQIGSGPSGPNNTSMFTSELTQQKPTLSDEEHHISLPTGHST